MGEKIEIIRLGRSKMLTSEYKKLIQTLFVSGDVDKRLSYAKWSFVENPALHHDEDLPIYVCHVDGKEAGQLAIIPAVVMFSGEKIRGGWCVDFFVSPDFQRRGIGKKLLAAAFADFPILMTLGQTDASFELFHSSLKWIYNENRLTCIKLLLKKRFAVKYIISKFSNFKKSSSRFIEIDHFALEPGESFTKIDSFLNYHDILRGQNATSEMATGVLRTSEFLEWRYLKHPFIKYRINKIELSNGAHVQVVWRVIESDCWMTASIVDFLYSSSVTVLDMKRAISIFSICVLAMGIEVIECKTSDKLVLSGFSKRYFSKWEPCQRFLYGISSMITCPVVNNDQWQLYSGDCDVESLNF